uniref:Uncharacterized protein n=1 Tax=Cacopsylla melanoneura TaxID=428564 RepID=A0A8D8U1Q5_9HEMI
MPLLCIEISLVSSTYYLQCRMKRYMYKNEIPNQGRGVPHNLPSEQVCICKFSVLFLRACGRFDYFQTTWCRYVHVHKKVREKLSKHHQFMSFQRSDSKPCWLECPWSGRSISFCSIILNAEDSFPNNLSSFFHFGKVFRSSHFFFEYLNVNIINSTIHLDQLLLHKLDRVTNLFTHVMLFLSYPIRRMNAVHHSVISELELPQRLSVEGAFIIHIIEFLIDLLLVLVIRMKLE